MWVIKRRLPPGKNSGTTKSKMRYGWEQGRVIAFDDSIVHSVQHRGQLNRTVMIVDILHPAHPDPSELLRDTTSTEELAGIRRRQKAWGMYFAQAG